MKLSKEHIKQIQNYYSKGFSADMIARHFKVTEQDVLDYAVKQPTSKSLIEKYKKIYRIK